MDRNDEKTDADILKGREDIQRLRKAADEQTHSLSEKPDDKPAAGPAPPSPLMKAVVDANKQGRTQADHSSIPRFDVADSILGRQRIASAARRTAPSKTPLPQVVRPSPPQHRTDQIEHKRPAYHAVIAQIVAADINDLCRGRVPAR
jgi:hypothetical protein